MLPCSAYYGPIPRTWYYKSMMTKSHWYLDFIVYLIVLGQIIIYLLINCHNLVNSFNGYVPPACILSKMKSLVARSIIVLEDFMSNISMWTIYKFTSKASNARTQLVIFCCGCNIFDKFTPKYKNECLPSIP